MHCLPCFQAQKSGNSFALRHDGLVSQASQELIDPETKKQNTRERIDQVAKDSTAAKTFTFRELATATRNFRQECLLGEGGFGRVFKGTLASNGQVVAVKQLDRSGMHGNKEFLGEIVTLSLLHHPNLVNLIGYCADGDQKLLVYEYMSAGSLENHLRDISPDQKPLDWFTRMRVALGIAKGLEYLHDQAIPPIIYRDLKPTNILLDEDYNPKLCDFGLAKLGPCGDPMCFPSRVVGSYGYCAPEYARSGQLTLKSDVYCFGVILLELITGRRALDTTRPMDEQNLVAWAQPIFKDPKRFPYMADPLLNKLFPEKDLNQAVAIAAMCLQEESAARPLMSDVVTALSFLSVATEESLSLVTAPSEEDAINDDDQQETKAGDSSGNEDNSSKSNDEHDNSRNEDKESEDHRNEDSEQEHDLYTSDRQDHDKSDCEEEDDVFIEAEDSADEHQQTDGGSKRRSQSRMKSINESVSASQKSSKKLGSRRVSPRQKSCIVTDDGSVSPGSQGSSEENALLRQKSSENSQKGFLSTKSSKNSTKASLNHISSKSSLFSLSHRSSRGSMEGSVSPSHLGSRRSQNDDSPFSRSSSGELMTEFDISSPWSGSKFQDGTASFDDGNSRGSHE